MVHHVNVPPGTRRRKTGRRAPPAPDDLVERSLAAFLRAGTLELSLDDVARAVGISKRMLIHYFGSRDALEERVVTRLEDALRAQFAPGTVPADATPREVVLALWERATAPGARGSLLLVMDLSRRAWRGSKRARAFYAEQQRLWVELLRPFFADRAAVEDILQAFQGAIFGYLITGDAAAGRRALTRATRATRA